MFQTSRSFLIFKIVSIFRARPHDMQKSKQNMQKEIRMKIWLKSTLDWPTTTIHFLSVDSPDWNRVLRVAPMIGSQRTSRRKIDSWKKPELERCFINVHGKRTLNVNTDNISVSRHLSQTRLPFFSRRKTVQVVERYSY